MDPAVIDLNRCRIGYFRIGVYNDAFDRLVKSLEGSGAISADFTRRKLQLDSPADSTTGWYSKSYEDMDIEGVLIHRATSRASMTAGVHVRLDATLFTADVLVLGDEVLDDSSNTYYEVKGVKSYKNGDSFSHREVDLAELPLHKLSYSPTAPTVNDARYNTKDYWDTYLSDTNLQSYKYLVCYANSDYPLVRVFDTKGFALLFAIDTPNSTPIPDYDLSPRGYKEHVPTHVLTLNTEVNHLGVSELRRITEENPTGSERSLEVQRSTQHNFGSTIVYDTEVMLTYRRDPT